MAAFPDFTTSGDLPPGVHRASLTDVLDRFGQGTPHRRIMAQRLQRIYTLAIQSGHVRHFIIFGSFVTTKPAPGDVDIFLMMEDDFDVHQVAGEVALIFQHIGAQNYEGASIFWIHRLAALEGEEAALA